MTDETVPSALRRLRHAADRLGGGWLPTEWQKVAGPGPDRYAMSRVNVLGPLGAFEDPPLQLEPGSSLTVECDIDVPADIHGVPTEGEPLHLVVWSIFPVALHHVADDGATTCLLDEEMPPAASGPVRVTVVPALRVGANGRLRAEVRTFDTQVYKQWNWFAFTTPAVRDRFERIDIAWAQLYVADALASTQDERKAVELAAAHVPDDVLALDGAALERVLSSVADELTPLRPKAEAIPVHLVGHSHIDMNWLWTWPDTVEVIKRDFRSVLSMMDDYPEMHFTHSQPATYAVIRDTEPELFAKVREHIASGRWEPATMQWTEGDTNMASSEATARHFVESVGFTRDELGAQPQVFLAPDTFGHAGNLPQVAASGGTRIYYHHRCNPGLIEDRMWPAYWWEGQDGTRLLGVTTATYNGHITASGIAVVAVELASKRGLPAGMLFYGVGDHGGGPTRESLDALRRIQQAPGLPSARCSTIGAYADDVLRSGAPLPVHRGESSTTFEGCYTTHADTKRFNREGENLLQTADTLAALAGVDRRPALQDAWRTVLFNQFHDILDGSAIAEVYRDQAVEHERVVAAGSAVVDEALAVLHDGTPAGSVVVTNPLAWTRREPVFVDGLVASALAAPDGTVLPTQAAGSGMWFVPEVPAFGTVAYRPVAATEEVAPIELGAMGPVNDGREWFIVTTPFFRAAVRKDNGIVTSLRDLRTGRDLVPNGARDFRPELALGVLQLLDERPHDMSSWDHREVHTEHSLLTGAITRVAEHGPLRLVIEAVHTVRSSTITERITFHRDLPRIDFTVDVDWQEPGNADVGVPDLKVAFTARTRRPQAWFETPFAAVERAADGMEVPALRWAAVVGEDGGFAVLNDCKYGYDALGSRLRLTLVRTAYDPDLASDIGTHRASFSLVPLAADWRDEAVVQQGVGFNQPLLVRVAGGGVGDGASSTLGGWRPTVSAGPVVVSTMKLASKGRGRVIRLYESTGRPATVTVGGIPSAAEVWETNVVEDPLTRLPVDGGQVHLAFRPWQVRTLLID